MKFRDGRRVDGDSDGRRLSGRDGAGRAVSADFVGADGDQRKYTIEKTEAGATLKRVGDVAVRFPNRANPDQRLVSRGDFAVATLLSSKFGAMFKEEFVGEGLKMKGEWAKAGTLKLNEIESNGAWVRVGWDMPGTAACARRDSPAGVGAAE